jgi:hypothetical protein
VRSRVLVVANVTASSEELVAALRDREVHATLLMPCDKPGLAARDAMRPRLEQALTAWREAGIECDGEVGDQNPMDALHEAWQPGRFDEVIVSTLPTQTSKWLQHDLPHRIARALDVPVTHVVALSMRPERPHEPPPPKEKPALGPLSVLAWGGPRQQR